MRTLLRLSVLLGLTLMLATGGAAQEPQSAPPREKQVVFQADFEQANALATWHGRSAVDTGYKSTHALALEAKATDQGATVSTSIPVEQVRGAVLRVSAVVCAENVSAKPNPWNGIKCMLVVENPSGKNYPQAPLATGTFDWQPTAFRAPIPSDATNLTLVLGLEQVSGKAWFDDVRVTVVRPPLPPKPAALPGPMFKGHDLARLRGVMVSPNINAESLRVLGQWKANLIRFQLIRFGKPGAPSPLETYDNWLEGELNKLDKILPECERYGIHVVVDLHSPPGGKGTVSGYVGSDNRLFTDPGAQAKFEQVWRKIAARYRDTKSIWGYDLANEPVEDDVAEGCDDWPSLAERAAKAIRQLDPARALIVEPANWGGPEGLKDFRPLNISNVVYSVHMYVPHEFTHQGVFEKGPAYKYPGIINGRSWDKAQLEQTLQPVVDFQRRYNVHIYIGEFSAIRWAPDHSAFRYLKDLIDIFEQHGWDWSYHAFREWQGWSVEHGSNREDPKPAETITERQQLLMDWFARN